MTTDLRTRATDLFQRAGSPQVTDLLRQRRFTTLTQWAENEDPSESAELRQGLDAFSRMLWVAGLSVRGNPITGERSSPIGAFQKDENTQALFKEWFRRTWSGASTMGRRMAREFYGLQTPAPREEGVTEEQQRAAAMYFSSDYIINTIQRPYDDDPVLRYNQIAPAIPLSEVVARTRLNDGPDYRVRTLIDPAVEDIRYKRVGEGAEIPISTIKESSRAIRIYKYGRAIKSTYEAMRRLPVEDLAVHIRFLAMQLEVDQVSAAFDVLINGDGNSGTSAVNYNLTALDPTTTANTETARALIALINKFTNPYMLTHMIANEGIMTDWLTLNIGTANVLQSAAPPPFGINFNPIQPRTATGIRYGNDATVPANKTLAFDARFALEYVLETGSEINESDRWITNQTEVLTFSRNEGFAVWQPNASKIVSNNA